MSRSRLIVPVVLLLVGLLWIGQGTGTIAGSAMSGNGFWTAVGVLLVAIAVALFVRLRLLSSHL